MIEFLEDQNLGFHLGNVVKYICRANAGHEDGEAVNLGKAMWYLQRQIQLITEKLKSESAQD